MEEFTANKRGRAAAAGGAKGGTQPTSKKQRHKLK
jgi:hypothetical protein